MSAPLQDAQFVRLQRGDDGASSHVHVPDAHGAQGVRFACPCGTGHILTIWFANPLGAVPVCDGWRRTGETLETLTLEPSIHVNARTTSCWHGYVRGGRTVGA